MSRDNRIGVYIHIPFCKSKCYYCDFNSYSGRDYLAGSYFDALNREIVFRSSVTGDRPVSSIFIGGGTPSLVRPEYISSLLENCSKHMRLDHDAEISMESNPGTLTYDKLKSYRQAGVNRLSIGLQAWQDHLLKMLGRVHDRRQYVDNLEAAVKAGFDNINTDIIFGLPGQSFEDWAETIEEITGTGLIKHISCYSLKIEEGTVFGDRLEEGTLQPADDELDRSMYHHAVNVLEQKNYRQYEISNFAMPGYECRHNLIYWKAAEYAGFGAGAHSYLDSVRFNNIAGIENYIRAVGVIWRSGTYSAPVAYTGAEAGAHSNANEDTEAGTESLHENIDIIGRDEAMSEYMILGLRLNEGITSTEFEKRFGQKLESIYGNKLDRLVKKGLISADMTGHPENGARYSLTRLGADLANMVFVEFV